MFNLNQPAILWIAAIAVIIVASLVIFWVRRNYRPGKITIKPGPVELELERKPAKSETPAPAAPSAAQAQPVREQVMQRSPDGEQEMHSKGGVQKQKMTDSERGKQRMD